MAKRSVIIFIVSLLILLAISLWLFTARIVSFVVPPLVNNETLEIDTLQISSIGWKQASIARVSGRAETGAGRIYFDIRDASVTYDLKQLQPGHIEIDQTDIDYESFDQPTVDATPPVVPLVFPPEVVVNQLRFQIKESPIQFNGRFKLSGSVQGFSALASDDKLRLELVGDASLANLKARMEQSDGTEIADFKLKLENLDLVDFDGAAQLTPLLTWLQSTQFIPKEYQDLLRELQSAIGSVNVSAHHSKDNAWQANIKIDASNIATNDYYASIALQGNLNVGIDGWAFTYTHPGSLRVHIPSYGLDDISTIGLDLPKDYAVSQGRAEQQVMQSFGAGEADFTFHRTGETDLSAKLIDWKLSNWKNLFVDLRNLEVLAPYAVNADSLKSNIRLTNISPLLVRGDIDVSMARTDNWPEDIPSFDLQGDWNWNDGAFEINGVAYWQGAETANWSVVAKEDSGASQIELEKSVAELFQPMQGFLNNRKHDMSFSDGSISGQLDWAWDKKFYNNRLQLTATGVEGHVLGLRLQNGSIEVNSSDVVALSLQFESSIPMITLANDVEVTDLNMGGRWQNGLYVDHADLSIFGGRVRMNPVFLSFSGKPNTIELEVSDIDLAEVLLMIDPEGLKGSGKLSGNVPLRLTSDGIEVDDGYLENTTKGTLSYNLSGESVPQLDNIALQALQDFRYDALEVQLNYQTNGDYTILSRLEGRNPQLYDGYPIAFNINLTGSLPGLLRASLITGDFHSEILKRIQQEQQ